MCPHFANATEKHTLSVKSERSGLQDIKKCRPNRDRLSQLNLRSAYPDRRVSFGFSKYIFNDGFLRLDSLHCRVEGAVLVKIKIA